MARRAAGAAVFALVVASTGDGPRPPGGWRRRRAVPAQPDQLVALRAAQGLDRPLVRAVRAMARRPGPARSRPLDALRPSGRRPGRRARVQHRDPGLGGAGVRDADRRCRWAATPASRGRGRRGRRGSRRWLLLSVPPLVGSLLLVLVAARTGWAPVGGMPAADLRGGAWFADAAAAPAGAGAGAGAAAGRDARAVAGAIDGRGRGTPVRASQPGPRALGAGRAAAARLAGVAGAGARRLRRHGRRALQRILRGRDGHGVARPRPAAHRRPARPRRLAGRRLRRRRRGAARGGDAGDRRRALGDRSARAREGRR